MRALVLLWLALPLAALAPTALACVAPAPASFERIAPSGEEGQILTEADGAIVRYWWSNGSFANVTPLSRPGGWAASPDGAWIVKVDAERDDACRVRRDAAFAVPTAGGAPVALEGERLDLLAAGARHVVLDAPREGETRLYEWGRWDAPARTLRLNLTGAAGPGQAGNEPGDYRAAALSPDGQWLVLAGHGSVHLIDVHTGELVDHARHDLPVQAAAVAFSPRTWQIAVLTSEGVATSRLWVYGIEVGRLALLDVEAFGQAPLGLAWGDEGLVAAFNDRDALHERPLGVARRFSDPGRLADAEEARFPVHELSGGPLWQDGRLIAGVGRGMVILDASLRPVLWSFPGRPATFDEPFWAPTASEPRPVKTPPPAPPPTPPPASAPPTLDGEDAAPASGDRRVDAAPPASLLSALALAAVLRSRRRGR